MFALFKSGIRNSLTCTPQITLMVTYFFIVHQRCLLQLQDTLFLIPDIEVNRTDFFFQSFFYKNV